MREGWEAGCFIFVVVKKGEGAFYAWFGGAGVGVVVSLGKGVFIAFEEDCMSVGYHHSAT